MRLFRTEVRDARYVSKRAPYKCLRCLCQYALGAACWLPTLMAMLAEYQHWFDGIVVNGTESFEGAWRVSSLCTRVYGVDPAAPLPGPSLAADWYAQNWWAARARVSLAKCLSSLAHEWMLLQRSILCSEQPGVMTKDEVISYISRRNDAQYLVGPAHSDMDSFDLKMLTRCCDPCLHDVNADPASARRDQPLV